MRVELWVWWLKERRPREVGTSSVPATAKRQGCRVEISNIEVFLGFVGVFGVLKELNYEREAFWTD